MGKTIIITGASRGIGLATAKRFISEGWQVIGTYCNNSIPLKADNFRALKLDLSSSGNIGIIAQNIKENSAKIDVLVNNAGVVLDHDETALDLEKTRKTFEIDVFALMNLTEKLLPQMAEGAHIINIGSGFGSFASPINDRSHSAYRVAKAAVHMYSRTLAFRLKERGIIVSTLDPGWVKTDMGFLGVKETDEEQPDREPMDAAQDILQLVKLHPESGCFWRFGKTREW